MARPDSMRNSHDLTLISGRVLYAPVINTIAHAITRTTDVRTAVATSELACLTPHFESIAVSPAKTAENIAATIYMI